MLFPVLGDAGGIGETRRRIKMGERDRGREDKVERRVERKEKTKRPSCSRKDRVVGYVSILFLVLVLESSQSGVSTRGETLFLLLLLCKRLEGRDDKVPSDC